MDALGKKLYNPDLYTGWPQGYSLRNLLLHVAHSFLKRLFTIALWRAFDHLSQSFNIEDYVYFIFQFAFGVSTDPSAII